MDRRKTKTVALQGSKLRRATLVSFSLSILFIALPAVAAEHFVNKQGNDANNGSSRQTAFLTIQKGVDALKPGDTLAVGPGEYFENVKLYEFGDLNRETLIRAEVPGTVVLRGDRDVDLEFSRVPERRFVYVADCDLDVLTVQETDTLTNVAPSANLVELDFGPGRFYHDAKAKRLYVSSSDFQPTERHHYTVGVTRGHGFHMFKCRRVVLDGLAASAYRTPVEKDVLLLPVSGFMLHECARCVVRRCTAYYNASGITINSGVGASTRDPGEGRENLVEDCVAYANGGDGIVAYNPACETFRDCRAFLNQVYGVRFYGGRGSDEVCLMDGVIAWGNPSADFWMKGMGLSEQYENYKTRAVAERCIAFRGFQVREFRNCVIGGTNVYSSDRSTSLSLPEGHEEFHEFLDANFADPLNYDYRYQATSSFRQPVDGKQKGPYSYTPDIYYVKTNGNDAGDGLSIANALKTPAAAARKMKPGDTLYIAPGLYAGDLAVTARDVRIRGRGLDPVVIGGGLGLSDCENVSVNRIQFSGSVHVTGGKDVELTNCVFAGSSVEAGQVEGLRMEHNLCAGSLNLRGCSRAILSANLYASAPAVSTDSLDAVAYSSYNSYSDVERCWTAGGKVLSLEDLRPRHDTDATVAVPELGKEHGATFVLNEYRFGGRGPLSTAIGPYREWQPKQISLMGPFVESASATSADIEWWSTAPTEVEFAWGDTPACTNRRQFKQNAFYSHGLLGLQPGKKYYVKVSPTTLSSRVDPARRFTLAKADAAPVEFTTGGGQAHEPTLYYVALDGDDAQDGLSRATAWRSPQTAADRVGPGDTVLIAGGTYPGTFYFRRTGEPGKPITFKAAPGERVLITGNKEKLHAGLILYGKHHYRVDSLYFCEYSGIADNVTGKEAAALFPQNCEDLQVTRCHFSNGWARCAEPRNCPNLLLKNCVFKSSMESVMLYYGASPLVENCLFISPFITHIHMHSPAAQKGTVRHCIFGENTRGKLHACPVMVDGNMIENCFYMRCSQYQRKVYNNKTLPEHLAEGEGKDSLYANPYMPGGLGFRMGWQQLTNSYESENPYEPIEFNRLFPTNPELVIRDIGLQAEAFSDFHFFAEEKWPYTKEWAKNVKTGMDSAEKLREAGQAARASVAYTGLAEKFPMSDRLKTDVLDRAAQCAAEARDYPRAMRIAESIPLRPFLIRRCMAILIEQKKYAELIKRAVGDSAPQDNWVCPEDEMIMADAFTCRGLAYAETGDLQAAEKDMRMMIDKTARWGYSPGFVVLTVAWRRLGDFYRTYAKDDAKALEAYREALKTETNPEIAEDLAAAARGAAQILRKQGKDAEARQLEQRVR